MLIHGDCLEEMKKIPDNSVDICLTDPPYGTTACKWDTVIPLEPMWEQLHRIVKDNGAICLFGQNPYTANLIMSNPKTYRYDWIWNKNNSAGFALAKVRPFIICENISIFSSLKHCYYPQMETRGKPRRKGGYTLSENYNGLKPSKSKSNTYYPKNLLHYGNANQKGKLHPTQKPVALLEYLIKTYTLENETVLDFTMGSGSTGVACKNLGRNFIGIEKDKTYFDVAVKRIAAN